MHMGTMSLGLRFRAIPFLISALAITTALSLGQAPGVTDDSILIGSCSALDGPARFPGKQTLLGATTHPHSVNGEGGIFGRKVQLLAFESIIPIPRPAL